MSTHLRPEIALPVLQGRAALVSFRLFAGSHWQREGLFRVMIGEKWLDQKPTFRTLSECVALVHEAAAAALGVEIEAPPEWEPGTAVRVALPGFVIRGHRSQPRAEYSPEPRLTRTRTMCPPYTRGGIHYVRVVGGGEVECSRVEVVG